MRVGIGFDAHRLVAGRSLVLGGVAIPFEKGLLGHSDGDVLLHAICDALLGAASLGDMGKYFPSSDPKYKDASSMLFLEEAARLLRQTGSRLSNVDATIIAQWPTLQPYLEAMRERVAKALGLELTRVSVKAKSSDGLGFTGRGEGIAAMAVVAIEEQE
ncbi:MAG: 2-C-methyl-D-erythritol 2,4-cyclodiphosphate synthase [Chloroflexi bacterium]|nr:2-C-methyl-D-erythritol 2,4-cyclodiphosphate synthase [Chloroflexota bacterium]